MNINQLIKENESPIVVFNTLTNILNPTVYNIYDTLTQQGHFSKIRLNQIVEQFFKNITIREDDQFTILAATALCDQLLKKANDYDTYRSRQNRFLTFFNEVIHRLYPSFKNEALKAEKNFVDWYTSFLFEKIVQQKSDALYEKLISTWLLCESCERKLISNARKLIKLDKNNLFFIKLASLLYLQANDGAKSLSLLKNVRSSLHYSELVDHFLIMEQKKDFTMMKHWFDLFFRHEKPKKGTVLYNLYEEMLFELGTEEDKIKIVWGNWLNSPSFSTYKTNIAKMTGEERHKVLQYILPVLQNELYRPNIETVYYQIIAKEQLFSLGVDSLLTHKKDVSGLSAEIEKLLSLIFEKEPKTLLPFYHQLVERLVQMKSRVHYEESIIYIHRLKVIYEKLNMQSTFDLYITGLKQRFKTFRAFIQELKKIDQ